MTITELITALETIKAEHGDLQVLTGGFDECGMDEVATVELEYVKKKRGECSHCGEYSEWGLSWNGAPPSGGKWQKVLKVDF